MGAAALGAIGGPPRPPPGGCAASGSAKAIVSNNNVFGIRFRMLLSLWRTHSSVPRRQSCRRLVCSIRSNSRSHECERGTHECVRHVKMRLFLDEPMDLFLDC